MESFPQNTLQIGESNILKDPLLQKSLWKATHCKPKDKIHWAASIMKHLLRAMHAEAKRFGSTKSDISGKIPFY